VYIGEGCSIVWIDVGYVGIEGRCGPREVGGGTGTHITTYGVGRIPPSMNFLVLFMKSITLSL
jgi:hypothetical protein